MVNNEIASDIELILIEAREVASSRREDSVHDTILEKAISRVEAWLATYNPNN